MLVGRCFFFLFVGVFLDAYCPPLLPLFSFMLSLCPYVFSSVLMGVGLLFGFRWFGRFPACSLVLWELHDLLTAGREVARRLLDGLRRSAADAERLTIIPSGQRRVSRLGSLAAGISARSSRSGHSLPIPRR
jgi:hypothetical protein